MTTAVAERTRADIADKYKWNLADLYASEPAWRAEKERIAAEVPALGAWRGQLASAAPVLADALEALSAIRKEFVRLYVYASMLSDQDTRDSTHQGMKQEMVQLGAAFAAESSYMEPEILRRTARRSSASCTTEPRLDGLHARTATTSCVAPRTR